jgi:hypothetical protein
MHVQVVHYASDGWLLHKSSEEARRQVFARLWHANGVWGRWSLHKEVCIRCQLENCEACW